MVEKIATTQWLIGIDEAGRGPLAGPVAVGVVAMRYSDYNKLDLQKKGIRDSKKLSEKQRHEWNEWMLSEVRAKRMFSTVSLVSHTTIDAYGIVPAIKAGIENGLKRVTSHVDIVSPSCQVLLDGGLRAPEEFTNQTTIIRGDEKEPIIALASIIAKVTRDTHMIALAKEYPEYGFDVHKGYGTVAHYQTIHTHGLTPIHRKTFLKKIKAG